MEDINWREELLESANFTGKQERILKEGSKSLVDSWIAQHLYSKWKKLKGIKPEPPRPDCQSSFNEWSQRQ